MIIIKRMNASNDGFSFWDIGPRFYLVVCLLINLFYLTIDYFFVYNRHFHFDIFNFLRFDSSEKNLFSSSIVERIFCFSFEILEWALILVLLDLINMIEVDFSTILSCYAVLMLER